jgi:hypothetical protein
VTRRRFARLVALAGAAALAAASVGTAATSRHAAGTQTVTVAGTQWGVSSCYIGATEGNVRFNIQDLTDAGINTYRV